MWKELLLSSGEARVSLMLISMKFLILVLRGEAAIAFVLFWIIEYVLSVRFEELAQAFYVTRDHLGESQDRKVNPNSVMLLSRLLRLHQVRSSLCRWRSTPALEFDRLWFKHTPASWTALGQWFAFPSHLWINSHLEGFTMVMPVASKEPPSTSARGSVLTILVMGVIGWSFLN